MTTWDDVMIRANYRCGCRGECGRRSHDAAGCDAARGLVVAPATPGLSDAEAARVPATGLRAWCPRCLHDAAALVRRECSKAREADMSASQGDLFAGWSA